RSRGHCYRESRRRGASERDFVRILLCQRFYITKVTAEARRDAENIGLFPSQRSSATLRLSIFQRKVDGRHQGPRKLIAEHFPSPRLHVKTTLIRSTIQDSPNAIRPRGLLFTPRPVRSRRR